MGKYFKKKVKKKKSKLPLIIIGAIVAILLIVGIIIGIIALTKKLNKPEYKIKTDISLELNDKTPNKSDLFSVYKNIKDNMIIVNFDELDMTNPGNYNIFVTVNVEDKKEDYVIIATVSDTTKPALELKELTIDKGSKYTINDFVVSCNDNSTVCETSYDDVSYEKITEVGTHKIIIKAIDKYNNEIVKETKLIIKDATVTPTPEPKPEPTPEPKPEPTPTCKYGSTTPIKNLNIPITYNLLKDNNNCPISVDDYDLNNHPDTAYTQAILKMGNNEIEKLWKDTSKYKVKNATLNPMAIRNEEKTGIIGYSIHIILYVDESGKHDRNDIKTKEYIKAEYYLNSDGTRKFVRNDYKLA